MKAIKLSILAAMMLTAGISTVKAQTADEIIQKHIDAIGGTENWNKIKSMKKVGSMSMQGMEIGFTQTVVNDKGQRMDISVMGQNGYVIVTKKEGWMYMPFQPGMDKVTPMPAEQVKSAQSQMNVKFGLLVDKSEVAKAEFVGKDTVNNINCLKVKITDKEGNEQTAFFDAATYYIVHSERKMKIQDEEQEIAVNFSNFQKQPEGIVIPMTVTAPMGQGDITFKSVEINKPVDDKTFVPDPADKK